QYQNLQNQMATLTDMMSKLVNANTASSFGSGTLPEELKGITTQIGVAYQGPKTPSPSKQGTKVTKAQVQTPSSQNTALVQPSVIQSESQALVSEPVVAPVSASTPNLKPSIAYPSRRENEKRRDQANEQIKKFYEIFKEMNFKISFTDALILMPEFASTLKALIENKEKISEMARTTMNEHCSVVILNKLPRKLGDPRKFLIPCEFSRMDECLALTDLGANINLMPLLVWEGLSLPELTPTSDFAVVDFEPDPRVPLILGSGTPIPQNDPIVSATSPTLTPFGDSDFLLFEEADAFLGLEDDPDSPKVNPFYYDPKGDILLLEAILNSKRSPPLPNQEKNLPSFKEELKAYEAQTVKSSVNEPPEVELKDLPHHLEYAFLEGDNKLPVIIVKELRSEEKAALIKVLKSHKRAIAWKLSDIQGAVLGQRNEKHFKPIHYASKTMNDAETNYTTTEKEMLAVVYAFEKFRSYLIMNKSIVHTDHSALKYLFVKKDVKARLLRWVLLLQEFDFQVFDTKGAENLAADHLSRLENPYENVLDPKEINENFPLETLSMVTFRGDSSASWFADFANYHARNFIVK
nr:reverse transcriptase domain-containing protein [Tanacetum cinerariifolium]